MTERIRIMATLQVGPNEVVPGDAVEPDAQPHNAADFNLRSYLDRIKDRLSRIPTTPSFILSRTPSSGQNSPVSVTRTTSATTGSEFRESTSTAATSVLSLPSSFIVQGFHLSPGMPVGDDMQSIWTQQIKLRLRAILLHEIPVGTCIQEFMMAGKRPDALKPTVVVSCGDTVTKKKVVNIFKGLVWLQEILKENNIMFIVVTAKVRLSMGRTLDASCTSSLKVVSGDDLERGLYATLMSLEDQREDESQISIRSTTLKEVTKSISSSTYNTSNIRIPRNQRRDNGTSTTSSLSPSATITIPPTTLAPSYTTPASIVSTSIATSTSLPMTNRSPSRSWIIGPVLGSILGILSVALVIFFTRRKQRRRHNDPEVLTQGKSQLPSVKIVWGDVSTQGKPRLESENVLAEVEELREDRIYEFPDNEIYELPANDVGLMLAEDWPLPRAPHPLLFTMAERGGEKFNHNDNNYNKRKVPPALSAVGEGSTTTTLKIRDACYVIHPSLKSSACGLHLRLAASGPRKKHYCTLGGLIMVNGAVFGLTAGHPFKEYLASCSEHNVQDANVPESEVSTQGENEYEDELFVFNGDSTSALESSSDQTTALTDSHTHYPSPSPEQPNIGCTMLVDPTTTESPPYSVTIPTIPSATSENAPQYFDWAVLETLPYSVSMLPNKVTGIGPIGDTFIESIISEPVQGEVSILIAGNGAQVGYLHSSMVAMRVDELVLEVSLITLDQYLRKFPFLL